jgi:superfamily II RNA helicase
MVELFLRQSRTEEYLGLHDLLTTLSVFLGESEEKSIPISKLNCSPAVREELYNVYDDLEMYLNEEKNQGIQYDNEFWAFSTEWVEPVSEWLGGTISIAELASKYDLFEGNIQKALMKLAAIVEEFQSMAKIMEEVEWLKELEGCQQLILRGIVLAESLYLRL